MYVHLCVWPVQQCNTACSGVRYEYLGRCSGPVSQVWLFTPLFLPLRLHPIPAQSCGGGRKQWSLQHSHSPAESSRLSPAFLCPFISFSLSLPSWTEKNPYSLTRGRGMSVRLKKPLSAICRYPPSPLNATSSPFPPRFTWLVKQQSSKKGRRKKRCILSLPLAVSQCVPGLSCGLFLMTGWKKK